MLLVAHPVLNWTLGWGGAIVIHHLKGLTKGKGSTNDTTASRLTHKLFVCAGGPFDAGGQGGGVCGQRVTKKGCVRRTAWQTRDKKRPTCERTHAQVCEHCRLDAGHSATIQPFSCNSECLCFSWFKLLYFMICLLWSALEQRVFLPECRIYF